MSEPYDLTGGYREPAEPRKCSDCGLPIPTWDDPDSDTCGLCSLTAPEPTPAEAMYKRRWDTTIGYAGLPDPVGLPSIGQIGGLGGPSDTHLSDGWF